LAGFFRPNGLIRVIHIDYLIETSHMKSIVILISGRGSNMEAILRAKLRLEVRAVIANRPDAKGLAIAAEQGVKTIALDHQKFATREAFDDALANVIDGFLPDFIVLAGFMRIFSPSFIARYPRRIVNIHPSLLPSFPGLHTHQRALAAGTKIHGATVHFVTAELDHGPIIAQAAVRVTQDDTEDSLATRVLVAEHQLYPQVLRWLADDRVDFTPAGVVQIRGLNVLTERRSHPFMVPSE
jgi:phosphoribosylglycinamide formyltransferase-1